MAERVVFDTNIWISGLMWRASRINVCSWPVLGSYRLSTARRPWPNWAIEVLETGHKATMDADETLTKAAAALARGQPTVALYHISQAQRALIHHAHELERARNNGHIATNSHG